MTEEEAFNTVCPQTLGGPVGTVGTCITVRCMAWRKLPSQWKEVRRFLKGADVARQEDPRGHVDSLNERDASFRAEGFVPFGDAFLFGYPDYYGRGETHCGECGLFSARSKP
jgi:hypothetical protein